MYMTGHLKKLQSLISKSYFENIEYLKVQGFWSSILNPHPLQRALASVSEKWVNRDWSDADHRDFPSEKRIPDGAASAIAAISYVIRILEIMICESSMFKNNLMWDNKFQSWRLVFAMVPQTKDTPPTFYHVTWKQDQYGKWKTMNTPPYSALFKDLRNRNPMTESMHIQLHGSDFAQLPLSGNMKWLIEFPPAWSWFLSWSPGAVPEHFKDPSMAWASRSRASPAGRKCTNIVFCTIEHGQHQHQDHHRCSSCLHRHLTSLLLRLLRHHPWPRLRQQQSLSQHTTSRHSVQPRQCPSSRQPLRPQHRR